LARSTFALLIVFCLSAVLFTGCKDPTKDEGNNTLSSSLPNELIGKWGTQYDYFEISRSGGMDILKYDGGGYGDYAGIIVFVSMYDAISGVIIIQYISGAPDVSKPYHAIYYLDFKPGISVELNNTYHVSIPYPGNNNADTATLDQAILKFTRGNMGNFMDVAWSTAYYRQP
jgi:hypothetical protein